MIGSLIVAILYAIVAVAPLLSFAMAGMTRMFKPIRAETLVTRYNVASLAAASGCHTRPKDYPFLAAMMAHGTTGITLNIESDGGTITEFDLPMFDMAVETNELTEMPVWTPVNTQLQVGEKLNILSTSLTLTAEVSWQCMWTKSPLQGLPANIRSYRFTFTNTTDNESLGSIVNNAKDLWAMTVRGVDLEATSFSIGGKNIGWVPARQCSALNDIILPPQWESRYQRGIGGQELKTVEHNHGTGGASDCFLLVTV